MPRRNGPGEHGVSCVYMYTQKKTEYIFICRHIYIYMYISVYIYRYDEVICVIMYMYIYIYCIFLFLRTCTHMCIGAHEMKSMHVHVE